MSVFSMIKKGRQAAKEHRAELAKKEKDEAQKPPYKHIPTHAAIDALSGGPAGWRENDRARILEQNRRRSAMTASGIGMSGVSTPMHAGMPRVHSALSNVSYPSAYATPVVHVPRNYSYSSMPPGWALHSREFSYSPIDMATTSPKGKEVERIIDSSRTSRSSSKVSAGRIPLPPSGQLGSVDGSPSPVESSGNSTSSQDDLEMKPVVRHSLPVPPPPSSVAQPARPTSGTEHIHRLHPGRSRRVSDPTQSAAAPRRPLADDIPPVPALPPIEFGTAITTPEVFSSATSSASSVTTAPVGSSASLSAKIVPTSATPTVLQTEEVEAPRQAELVTGESSGEEEVPPATPAAPSVPTAVVGSPKKARRTSKIARFAELEPIKSNTTVTLEPTTPLPEQATKEKEQKRRPTSTATALPTSFDESALSTPKEIVLPTSKPGKLTKGPAAVNGKLVKKNRWSLRNSKSTAVAV
ncbi:b567e559-36e9-4015-850b-c714c2234f7b [Thermothielavioides terrestris]|uniref:B567e559-36e9-4015-850b-c714c2234f7b n=1 Tax=Thermothielavioides terrestris TaxID=2587410 RepID=A0A446BMC4_9PEZI|nr:b567e559-36e9-4015-850b-c714c2234f7b [Thermothielavioides terrestris]